MRKMPHGMGGGMPNMNNMLKQAQKMQQEMLAAQQELDEREYEVSAGGGAVTIKINGKKEITGMNLASEIVDPDDIETLCDIITAGVNEAIRKVEDQASEKMKQFTGGMSMPGIL